MGSAGGENRVFLSLRGISKTFPNGIVANDGIDLDLWPGEVHAILGENGAGKSTLVKTLYGFHRPDSGTIELDGTKVEIHSPDQAKDLGVGMVFQSFMLIPNLSVVENVALSLRHAHFVVRKRQIAAQITEVAARYGFAVDPWAMVWQLSPGDEQKVEIIKLLLADARVLIFDEPTSVLAPHEVEGLYQVFARLKDDGYAVVFITHKMREVLACADRITVLRRGRVAGTIDRSEATERTLVRMILGDEDAELSEEVGGHTLPHEKPLIELRNVVAQDDRGGTALKGVSLAVAPGEIVGVAGVSGSGQKELGDVLLGLRKVRAGSVVLDGQDVTHWPTARFLRAGVACVPEDPVETGIVGGMSVLENMALGDGVDGGRPGWLPVNWAGVQRRVSGLGAEFNLSMPRLDVPVETLSGGNVQRLVFARELSRQPRLLIAYYPTHGLDVAATHAVHQVLLACRDSGAAVLLISEDLEELTQLSDRLAVMYHGSIVGVIAAKDADLTHVGLLMTGGGNGVTRASA